MLKPHQQLMELFRDAPAWAVSLAVHGVIFMLMGTITFAINNPGSDLLLTSVLDQEMDPHQLLFEATVSDQIGTNANFDSLTASISVTNTPSITSDSQAETPVSQQLQQELLEVNAPSTELVAKPQDGELMNTVEVKGQTEHTGGVEGAMDRLTFEIATSLSDKPTLVIWLFDASNSLNERREAIAQRFENVYKQLGVLERERQGPLPLETVVVSFGQETKFMTEKPVADVSHLTKAIREIQPDESGKEYVFDAVDQVSRRYQTHRTKLRRNVMIVIVTDERGDDVDKLEATIAFNKRYGMKVYCVGNAALFGLEKGYIPFTWKEGENTFTQDLPADQGPETFYPERLQLPFWGGQNEHLERMSASFGPYALTRLCAETGGLYMVSAEGRGPTFDYAIMRNYSPDYRPIRLIDLDIKQNQAMQSVIAAAQLSRVNNIPIPTNTFRADTDNRLRQELTEAQKPLAVLDYQLNEMMSVLEKGIKDRERLGNPRWRASYDLSVGRVLAMRARSLGYNEMCAEMKSSPKKFETTGNNHWRLVPSNKVSSSAIVKKLASQADEYLTRVINEHPGTPWELLADRERQQPLGWEWQEFQREIPEMNRNPNDPQLLLADEERRRQMMNQPPRPKNVPKL